MSSRKHILHITYDMNIGGTEQVIKNLISGLDPERFTSSILCIDGEIGPWGKELQQQGIQTFCLTRRPGFDTQLIRKIRKLIKAHRFDILHCHQYTPWTYGVFAASFTKAKVIFTEHGRFYPDSSSLKRKLINPILALMTDHLTAISKATKQALIEYENLPGKRISVIYNGITAQQPDLNQVEKIKHDLRIPKDHVVLGTIARLDPIKNHKMMLCAFNKVVEYHPKVSLVIVGDGPERNNVEKQIADYKLKEQVFLPGYITNPTNYLAIFDIYLLSSLSEGTSMTLLEAMSQSKPCVVTDAGGNPEIIKDQTNGLVSANDDPLQFSESIKSLIQEKETRNAMASEAKLRFNALFTVESMAKQYQHLYLLSSKS